MASSSQQLIKCFLDRYNTRNTSILELFDISSTFEYMNIGQTMTSQEALTLMDLEVQTLDYKEDTLSIDYDPNSHGFSLFYITFEGSLFLKT